MTNTGNTVQMIVTYISVIIYLDRLQFVYHDYLIFQFSLEFVPMLQRKFENYSESVINYIV